MGWARERRQASNAPTVRISTKSLIGFRRVPKIERFEAPAGGRLGCAEDAMSVAVSADLPDTAPARSFTRWAAMVISKLVHVVDDEDSIRRSLDFLLRTAGFKVEKWPDGESFLKGADGSRACVLLDMRMPGMDGLQVQAEMAARGLNLPVIVLTGHGDISTAVRAMQAGALDFMEKPFSREQLLQALDAGFLRLADHEGQREHEAWARTQIAALTQREREVLEGLACGYPNKTIAYDLGISSRTVEVYRANVMEKLKVANFADALRIAFAAGLGSESEWRRKYSASMR